MLRSLDHCVIAVRDLDAAARAYASLLGRAESWRGEHPGAGTANALFRLEGSYVELLARSGEGPVGSAVDARLDAAGEGMAAIAFGTDDADACASALRARGVEAEAPRDGEGRSGDGAVRRWRSVWLPADATRGVALFAVEHRSAPERLPWRAAGAEPAAAVSAMDHVVVVTRDLEAAGALYRDRLGLRLALDRRFEARGLRILFFRVGGVTLEVVGALGAAEAAPEPDRFGGLAYRVADVDVARARLRRGGFDVSDVRAGAKPGTRVARVRTGTHGVPTLLIQPAPATPRRG